MILYLDTSVLVKLYVEEVGSSDVRTWVEEADLVSTCRVALPEVLSAFSRRLNRRELPRAGFEEIVRAVKADWPQYLRLDFDEIIAAELVVKHSLRGFDAVHLSAALLLSQGPDAIEFSFSSADRALNKAARSEGFVVLDAASPTRS